MQKKCRSCWKRKALSKFYKSKTNLDGYKWDCKECYREKRELYYMIKKAEKEARAYRRRIVKVWIILFVLWLSAYIVIAG